MRTANLGRLILAGFLLAATAAGAEPTSCPKFYLGGQAPAITEDARKAGSREFCYDDFALYHSSVTRTPIWSAEHLTKAMVEGGRRTKRRERFHAETRLDRADRSEDRDYTGSKYTRGHMTPSDDAPDLESQYHTFVMANMVPQKSGVNSGLWSYLEASVAQRALETGEVWVVTGPVFAAHPGFIKSKVAIPSHTFKAIYDPASGLAAAYVATNEMQPTCRIVSLAQLEVVTGLNVFPSLPDAVRQSSAPLPLPKSPRAPLPACH